MIKTLDQVRSEQINFDVCICGSGLAAFVLAMTFENTDLSVCLLESGEKKFNSEFQLLNKGKEIGLMFDEESMLKMNNIRKYCQESRVRAFGGNSSIWGGRCRPLSQNVFKKREWLGDEKWEISQKDLMEHYEFSENLLKLSNPGDWKNSKFKDFEIGPKFELQIYKLNKNRNIKKEFFDIIKTSKNITFVQRATVSKLLIKDEKVDRLKVFNEEGKPYQIHAKTTILSCGTIENVRILLSSNDQRPKGIGNENNLVGKYFMEHIYSFYLAKWSRPPHQPDHSRLYVKRDKFRNNISDSYVSYMLSSKKIESEHLLNCHISIKENIISEHFGNVGLDQWIKFLSSTESPSLSSILEIQSEQTPSALNHIRLGSDQNKFGDFLPVVTNNLSKVDNETVNSNLKYFAHQIGESEMGRVQMSPSKEPIITASLHSMGGARMNSSSKLGVTNLDGRVHSTKNLYILGGATFPVGDAVNPTLTIMALSRRLGKLLVKEG